MPDSQASRYSNATANSVGITETDGNEAHGLNYVCEPLWGAVLFHRDGVGHCLMDLSAFQPPAGATSLNLNVEIGGATALPHARHGEREIPNWGPWSFNFSLPFFSRTSVLVDPTPSQEPQRHLRQERRSRRGAQPPF